MARTRLDSALETVLTSHGINTALHQGEGLVVETKGGLYFVFLPIRCSTNGVVEGRIYNCDNKGNIPAGVVGISAQIEIQNLDTKSYSARLIAGKF